MRRMRSERATNQSARAESERGDGPHESGLCFHRFSGDPRDKPRRHLLRSGARCGGRGGVGARARSGPRARSRSRATGSRSGSASSATRPRSRAASTSSSSCSLASSARRSRRTCLGHGPDDQLRSAASTRTRCSRSGRGAISVPDPTRSAFDDALRPRRRQPARPRRVPAPALRHAGLAGGGDPGATAPEHVRSASCGLIAGYFGG